MRYTFINRHGRRLAVSVFFSIVCAHAGFAQVSYQTVALSGQDAPGLQPGVTYSAFFSAPLVTDGGQLTFGAMLSGAGVTPANDYAIYVGPPADPQLVARRGDSAPGAGEGVVYTNFGLTINDAGNTVLYSQLSGPGVSYPNSEAIFAGDVANPQMVVRWGDAAHRVEEGVIYESIRRPLIDADGRVLFEGFFTGTDVTSANNAAIYVRDAGDPQLIARTGNRPPGMPMGVKYELLIDASFSGPGHLLYRTKLTGTGVTSTNDIAIYGGPFGSPQLVAREGSAAPGTGAGVTYASLADPPVLNKLGHVGYFAGLRGTGVTNGNNDAIYAGNIASPQLVVREGDAAPGAGEGVVYRSFFYDSPVLNDAGQIAFSADLDGPGVTGFNARALFAGNFAKPQMIARAGDSAAGIGSDITYRDGGSFSLNNSGQVVYTFWLRGTDTAPRNDNALFAFDPARGNLLIAREGDLFDVGGGDMRIIDDEGIAFYPGSETATHPEDGLADDGTLTFRLKFTDGTSGQFTAHMPDTTAGDTDFDDDVDLADLGNLASSFGLSSDSIKWQNGDFDHDDDVDLNDLGTLATNFEGGSAEAYTTFQALVPEPGCAALFAGALALLPRRRRQRM
jgi:hypothetical protein